METVEKQPITEETAAPRKKGRSVLLAFLGFLLALGALALWVYHGVTPVVYGEYGLGVPTASAFCDAEDAVVVADEDAGCEFHGGGQPARGGPGEDLDLDVDRGQPLSELHDVDVHAAGIAGARLVQR